MSVVVLEGNDVPPIQFADARGARIAWQSFGSGPPVVAIPPTAQNIEFAWEWPAVRTMFDRFGSFCTFTQFDKRGTGASDRRSSNPGIDERVEDLRAVMDDAGIDRAFLYGASEGGPTCILFAVTYPDRVSGLILHGTGAYTAVQGLEGEALQETLDMHAGFVSVYGTAESPMVDGFAPSMADAPGFRSWHNRYERLSATRDSLAEILEISLSVDVSEVLGQVDVPTLILHATGDLIIPVEWGRELARGIENAQMFEYDSIDHFAYTDLVWADEMERFVTGDVVDRPPVQVRGQAQIHTMGRFEVIVDGEIVPNSVWGSRRARQLCKRLVAARGQAVRREELADLLWPDEADSTKLGPRLSVQLSAVRRVLGGGVIADRETVALDLAEVATDLEAFAAAATPSEIVATYGGDFLAGDLDAPWAAGVRDEARSRFTGAAHDVLSDEVAGASMDTEALARRLLELDQWDEAPHRWLVKHLHRQGRSGDARRAFDNYRAAMHELEIEIDSFDAIVSS